MRKKRRLSHVFRYSEKEGEGCLKGWKGVLKDEQFLEQTQPGCIE